MRIVETLRVDPAQLFSLFQRGLEIKHVESLSGQRLAQPRHARAFRHTVDTRRVILRVDGFFVGHEHEQRLAAALRQPLRDAPHISRYRVCLLRRIRVAADEIRQNIIRIIIDPVFFANQIVALGAAAE